MPVDVLRGLCNAATKGKCPRGFKVGDGRLIPDEKTPGGMRAGAYNSLAAAVRLFRPGGQQPWDKDRDITCESCPHPEAMLACELGRLRDQASSSPASHELKMLSDQRVQEM